jgi:hypothetical protein
MVRIQPGRGIWGLALFLAIPVHLTWADQALPFELALLLCVTAMSCFFWILEQPTVRKTAIYAGVLTLCIYTDRFSYLPALGSLLFLLRFANGAKQRKAIWVVLPAVLLPVLLFIPYFLWALPQVRVDWLAAPTALPATVAGFAEWAQTSPAQFAIVTGSVLAVLVLAALSLWVSFRPEVPVSTRIAAFCLAGGVLATAIVVPVVDLLVSEPLDPTQLLWAAPGSVILLFICLDWLSQKFRPLIAPVAAVAVLLVCAVLDGHYLFSPKQDFAKEVAALQPELKGDACVVFVSERFSKPLFLVFDPDLNRRECYEFFHPRLVLASHPWVREDQQSDAESFFRGLNFREVKRIRVGGGEIIVDEQSN